MDRLLQLHDDMQRELPGFKIREKRVWFWWVLNYVGLVFLWNPRFMETMWTTIGRTVFVPHANTMFDVTRSKAEIEGDFCTLWHERQHMLDLRDFLPLPAPLRGLIWFLGYGSPQLGAIGALGALWSPWWLFCLVFLGPWPSPFRVWVERRGYLASAEAWVMLYPEWFVDVNDPWMRGVIEKNFLGWRYFKMSWSRKAEEAWFTEKLAVLMRIARIDRSKRQHHV